MMDITMRRGVFCSNQPAAARRIGCNACFSRLIPASFRGCSRGIFKCDLPHTALQAELLSFNILSQSLFLTMAFHFNVSECPERSDAASSPSLPFLGCGLRIESCFLENGELLQLLCREQYYFRMG